MNQYGQRAMEHWQKHLPQQYREIEDPQAFFTTMGKTLANEIETLKEEILQNTPTTSSFAANLARLNRAQVEAEMEVFRQALPEATAA